MVHPTAIIEPGAEIGHGVHVGAFSYVGPHVRLADNCEVKNHVSISGDTTIGEGCVFFPHCVIGEPPQDIKHKGEPTRTVIGQDNHFRENVTVHAGTVVGGGITTIGNHNRFLVGVHLAHDLVVGDHVVISNNVQIAGHVHIENCVTMGGQSAIHHFVTVGQYAMLGGMTRVTYDVPPYLTTVGYQPEQRAVNKHGLKRWQVSDDSIRALTKAFKSLYSKRAASDSPFAERLAKLSKTEDDPHVAYLCRFLNRTLAVGNCGRHLEAHRQDNVNDSAHFFGKNKMLEAASVADKNPMEDLR